MIIDFWKPELYITERAEKALKLNFDKDLEQLWSRVKELLYGGIPLHYLKFQPYRKKDLDVLLAGKGIGYQDSKIMIILRYPTKDRSQMHIILHGVGEGGIKGALRRNDFKPFTIPSQSGS